MPDFPLPDLGEGLQEAEIVTWHVKAGDVVTVDQVVAEVETAKAVVEVPIPFAGVVTELHAAPGTTIAVGQPLITITTRRFDTQATVLAKQGRLAVYPSSRGQDACQVGAALALRGQDWLFPTYRDTVAVLTKGVPAKQALALMHGAKGIGYGVPSLLIDGNDAAAVYAAVRSGVERAAAGEGPTLIEAITYRIESHTNADDATRYRAFAEVSAWLERDPITRFETYLKGSGLLDDAAAGRLAAEAEQLAEEVRDSMNAEVSADPAELFEHVYAHPTAALERQRTALLAEIAELEGPEA